MKPVRLKTLVNRIAALLLCIFTLSAAAIVWDGLHDELEISDVAIVLGNKVNPDGRPSARLQARLDTTVALYQQGWFANILVSGGTGREGFDEAVVMKEYLVEKGVPEEIILVDSDGMTTYHTAKKRRANHAGEKLAKHDGRLAILPHFESQTGAQAGGYFISSFGTRTVF